MLTCSFEPSGWDGLSGTLTETIGGFPTGKVSCAVMVYSFSTSTDTLQAEPFNEKTSSAIPASTAASGRGSSVSIRFPSTEYPPENGKVSPGSVGTVGYSAYTEAS